MLRDPHKRKIDMSDEIFVINKNEYIGENTRDEIEYAKRCNKKAEFDMMKQVDFTYDEIEQIAHGNMERFLWVK